MTSARSVLLILLLLAGSPSPPAAHSQVPPAAPEPAESARSIALEQNYPNPVNPETWIPFYLGEPLFDEGAPVTATIRVYNILSQVVAIPEATEHPSGRGVRVIDLAYSDPGRKVAYWDGNDTAGRPVPSGVYYVQLVVGEETMTRKLTVLNPRRRRTIFPW